MARWKFARAFIIVAAFLPVGTAVNYMTVRDTRTIRVLDGPIAKVDRCVSA
jgi:hypothetical protein